MTNTEAFQRGRLRGNQMNASRSARDRRNAAWEKVGAELAALRAENARLREELERALNWMTECADREKAQCYKRGYLVRIQAASAALGSARL